MWLSCPSRSVSSDSSSPSRARWATWATSERDRPDTPTGYRRNGSRLAPRGGELRLDVQRPLHAGVEHAHEGVVPGCRRLELDRLGVTGWERRRAGRVDRI